MLRALGLGDLLTGVPALRALKRGLPGNELVLATPPALASLVALAGVADRLLPAQGLAPLGWTGPTPEVAVNLHGRGPQSHRLLQSLQPRRLSAFGCAAADVVGPAWRPDEHEVRRWCRLVTEALAIPADPGDLLLPVPPSPPPVRGAVVVHPGAAHAARRWPVDRFAAVARWAAGQDLPVAVTGSATERDLAERVAALAGLPFQAVLAGRTDLAELASLVAAARLVVSGDTGVAHLASAFRTPSVVLFGPTPPTTWGPPESGPHVGLWHGSEAGDPWARQVDPALLRISVEEVLRHAEELIHPGASAAPRTSPGSP